ncbi:MAG: arylformamidase [Sphingobacteriales bacterium]
MFLLGGCASNKTKNIPYLDSKEIVKGFSPKLNVFSPKKGNGFPVVIFVHGGNWNAGSKDTYNLMGRNFGRKDVVTVTPSYTLSPKGNFDTMAQEIAEAVKWTKNNIKDFGGDPEKIYLMGHSAGGHLVAIISTNPKYLDDQVNNQRNHPK